MSKTNPPPQPAPADAASLPPHITLAHIFHAPAGWSIRERTMTQYVLQYCMDGSADYPVEDRPYRTVRGDLLLHRPGERHSILMLEGVPYVCISIVFHFGEAALPVESALAGAHLLGNFADHPIHDQLAQLVLHYRQPGDHHRLAAQGLLLQILAGAAEARMSGGPGRGPTAAARADERKLNARMALVKNHLAANFDREPSAEELERISGLSRNYITIQFKRNFGLTPSQYVQRVRVEKAKELALHTGLSIGEIAHKVGYADVHTFGRMFKKQTGYNLSSFRPALFGNFYS